MRLGRAIPAHGRMMGRHKTGYRRQLCFILLPWICEESKGAPTCHLLQQICGGEGSGPSVNGQAQRRLSARVEARCRGGCRGGLVWRCAMCGGGSVGWHDCGGMVGQRSAKASCPSVGTERGEDGGLQRWGL